MKLRLFSTRELNSKCSEVKGSEEKLNFMFHIITTERARLIFYFIVSMKLHRICTKICVPSERGL
jgi:hypothetical protein